jgi:hypothetical protein
MSEPNKSNFNIAKAGMMLVLVMSVFLYYANTEQIWRIGPWELKKSLDLKWPASSTPKAKKKTRSNKPKAVVVTQIDTTPKRFLLVGDSEVEGLMYPFDDYCRYNGDSLLLAHVWYSATDMVYANNDSLKKRIEEYKPDHIVMVIGLNQVTQQNFSNSEKAVQSILQTFGDIPYTWIGPANWIPDLGINQLYADLVDSGQFFYSGGLVLERGKDGRHPSKQAYYVWMDSIAQWMEKESIHHIRMKKPDTVFPYRKINRVTMNASRRKNNNAESKSDEKTDSSASRNTESE